ncbi:glycine cleavage T C-terminal barrel domain-containing protein [soil metagenome]
MNQHPVVMYELEDRPKLSFSGPQALWFLNQLLSNQLEDLKPDEGAEALLLTPKGRITSVLRVLANSQGALADADGSDRQTLVDFFTMRIFATRVQVADVTDDFTILRVLGPGALTAVANGLELTEPLALEPHANLSVGSAVLVTLAPPLEGLDIWVPPQRKPDILELLGKCNVRTASRHEYEVMRLRAGTPAFASDLAGGYLPQEAALERAVHFKKGCYLGQEAVAMAQRGRVKKRLRHLRFTGSPLTGEISYDGRPAGTVTSASDGFGIAMVKTSVPLDAEVVAGDGATATVHELPGTSYGPSVPSARELRERLQSTE